MQTRNEKIILGIGAVLLIACLFVLCSREAAAEESDHQNVMIANGPNICHSALPVYDTHMRKRPLAIANEGTSNAFVTCAFQVRTTESWPHSTVKWYALVLRNMSNTPKTINCVGVVGVDDGDATYYPQSTTLAVGERKMVIWSDYPYAGPVGTSCDLPVLTAINETIIRWDGSASNSTTEFANPNIINK